ncbi:autotransporter passenger strand-loop-strand repeat protein, partial [Bartonella japonica]
MMRHKCRLGFSVLIISSYLMQGADAGEKKNGELTELEDVGNGGTVPSGSVLATSIVSVSNNIKIEDGSVEIVDNGAVSVGATIKKGGMQIVTRGGNAVEAKILGGKQFVHEEYDVDLKNVVRKSSAFNTTVFGAGEAIGQQNIYDGAWAWHTKVGQNGEQNLYAKQRKEGGNSMETVVSGNGRQHVLAGGEAHGTRLSDTAVQVIYPGGFADTLTIEGNARSWLHVGAKDIVGEVRVNGGGRLYLFAGDVTDRITKKEIPLKERVSETIFLVGERSKVERPQIKIEDLGGEGGTVIFTSIGYDPRHISLHVERLSGDLHFRFNISDRSDRNDYLTISDEGLGNHRISVSDSGSEITAPLSQKNSLFTEIPLITDQSSGNGANFALETFSGQAIEAVDGGTYMYRLCRRDRRAEHGGDAITWYLGIGTANTECSSIPPRRTSKRPKTTVFSHDTSSGVGISSQRDSSSSRRRGTVGSGKKNEQPSRPRPPRHLREAQRDSISLTVVSSEDQVINVSRQVGQHDHFDQKQQPVISAEDLSLSDQMTLRPHHQDKFSLQSNEEISVSNLLTTPSTDAVLSLSVSPGLIFHNELQAVRAGRGVLDRDKKDAALWIYTIK